MDGYTVVDLSVPTESSPSEATETLVEVLDHVAGASVLGPGPSAFPDGYAISNERVQLTSHSGTHMDAPLHYGPWSGKDRTERALPIDEVPLEWCIGPGLRLDFRHVPAGSAISREEVQEAIAAAGGLKGGEIVLLWTGADALWGSPAYLTDYAGLSGEATTWLIDRGVRVVGIDAWGLDRPATAMLREFDRTGDGGVLWPAHVAGRTRPYLQLEKLANLGALPGAQGFTVCAFPVRLAGAGAGWARVVGLVGRIS